MCKNLEHIKNNMADDIPTTWSGNVNVNLGMYIMNHNYKTSGLAPRLKPSK